MSATTVTQIQAEIALKTTKFCEGIEEAVNKVNGLNKVDLGGLESNAQKAGESAKKATAGISGSEVTQTLEKVSGAVLNTTGIMVDSYSSWEDAFTGVMKTIEVPPGIEANAFFEGIQADIFAMSKEIPTTVEDIASIYEAAGQLGIGTEYMTEFSRTMLDVGNATNITAEEAATTFAQFANITGMDQSNFDNLGAALVALGNNSATTESDIASMAFRLAGAGSAAGMSEADILGISAAFSSLGIGADAGGTAVSKVFNDMSKSVATGGDKLELFAQTAGISAAEFSTMWENDAAGAFTAFVSGLGKAGDEVYTILDDLDISDARQVDAFLRASGAVDQLTDSLEMSRGAWDSNSALSAEAEQRYNTFSAQSAVLSNQLHNMAISIGSALVPVLSSLLEKINPIVGKISDFIGEHSGVVAAILGIGSALSVAFVAIQAFNKIKAVLGVFKVFGSIGGIFAKLGPIFAGIGSKIAGLVAAMGPVGWAILGVIALIGGLAVAWNKDFLGMKTKLTGFWNESAKPFFTGLGEKAKSAWGSIKTFAGNVKNSFATLAPAISEKTAGLRSALGNVATSMWTGAQGAFSAVRDKIAGFLDGVDLATALSTAWSAVCTAVSGWWDGLSETVTTLKSNFAGIFSGVDLATALSTAWSAVTTAIAGWWDGLSETVATLKGNFAALFSGVDMATALSTAWSAVTTAISGWWDGLSETITTIKGNFAGLFSGLDLTTSLSTAWGAVKTAVAGWWGSVSETFATIKGNFAGIFSDLDFLTPFKAAWDKLTGWFTGAFDSLFGPESKIGKLLNKFKGGDDSEEAAGLSGDVATDGLTLMQSVVGENGALQAVPQDVIDSYNFLAEALGLVTGAFNTLAVFFGTGDEAGSGTLALGMSALVNYIGGEFTTAWQNLTTQMNEIFTPAVAWLRDTLYIEGGGGNTLWNSLGRVYELVQWTQDVFELLVAYWGSEWATGVANAANVDAALDALAELRDMGEAVRAAFASALDALIALYNFSPPDSGKSELNTKKLSFKERQMQGRAGGGYVASGTTYMVGEEGPELFTPRRSGYIIPNDELNSGRGQTVINVTFSGDVIGDETSIRGMVTNAVSSALRKEMRAYA